MRLTSRPDLSGSGGPRSILAYYSALWRTCHDNAGAYNMPIVIDSPNQQGQDHINLPTVLKFIAKDLPEDAQLIVGLEAPADFEFDKEIRFDTQYSLLKKMNGRLLILLLIRYSNKCMQLCMRKRRRYRNNSSEINKLLLIQC